MSGAGEKSLTDKQRKRYKGAREPVYWSPKLWNDILGMVRAGASVHFAAATYGVTTTRLRRWLEENEAMREEFNLAEEQGHARLFTELRAASQGDIKGLQWLLQKRFPEVWGERQTIQFSGPDNSAEVAMEKLERIVASCKEELTNGVEPSTDTGEPVPED